MEEWDNSAWFLIEDGITYIEADAVVRWLNRSGQPKTAESFKRAVDHLVRSGFEKKSKKWRWLW